MDPLTRILARYGLTAAATLDRAELAELTDDQLEHLNAELLGEAHRRQEALAHDATPEAVTQLAEVVDTASTVLDELGTRPAVVQAAAARLAGRTGLVAAATSSATSPVRNTRVAVRRPAASAPRLRAVTSAIVASGGTSLDGWNGLVAEMTIALHDARRGVLPAGIHPQGRVRVAQVRAGDDVQRLGHDAFANRALVASAVTDQLNALTAAGGICIPPSVRYDQEVAATDARPVRDALVLYLADRGGVQIAPPPTLADVADGVGVWTEANDRNPSNPATKAIVTITCPEVETVTVEAITRRMRLGNFRRMFWPEQVDAWLTELVAAHARLAETELLAAITAKSTAVTSGQLLGATRDVLTTVDRAAAAYRSRQRMDGDAQLVAIFPTWLSDMMTADLAREMPGSSAERLATLDLEIDRFFTSRHVTPIWSLDAQPFGAQGIGPLTGWPSTVTWWLFAPGTWLFLDGGMMDFGVIRDHTLNETNSAETFAETFEAAAMVGTESLVITSDVCPDGATSAAVDIAPCATGS